MAPRRSIAPSKAELLAQNPDLVDERVTLDPDATRAEQLQELEELDEQEDGELIRVMEEIRASGAVRLIVMRTLPDTKKGYVGELTPAEFTYETVRKRWGAGRYRIRCMGPRGMVPGGGTIDIAEQAEAAPGTQPAGDLLSVLRAEREAERDRERAEKNEREERFLKWGAILVPVLTPAISGLFGAKKEGITELVTALASMKQLQGGDESKVDQFIKMFELAQSVGGKGGGETNWLDIVKEGISGARPLIENLATRALSSPSPDGAPRGGFGLSPALTSPLTTPPALPSSSATPTPDPSTSGSNQDNPMLALLPWLKNQLEFLIVQAARDRDPALYAELMVDNLPDAVKPENLVQLVSQDNWWTVLQNFNPQVKPYQGWFTGFRQELLVMLSGEERSNQGMDQPHHGHSEDES